MPSVFSRNNFTLAAAPPSYYIPNATGFTMPAGLSTWTLSVDLSGNIPAGQTCSMGVEYLIDGVWQPDAGVDWATGTFVTKDGATTGVHTLSSTIGGQNTTYPTAARIRVDQAGAWRLPSVGLDIQ